jgi:thioredoxin reductase (NADPH)
MHADCLPACTAMSDILDCLVVGGGPAGLTAAIYLGRFRRRVLVVDKGWSRAEWITKSHNLPGFPGGIAGSVLLGNLRAQARLYGAVLEAGVVDALLRDGNGLFSAKAGAASLVARTVILATGVIENKPPVAHVADAVKRGLIRTCPICDGYESIGKHIAVLGDGEHAAAEALFLRTYTDRLSLLLTATETAPLSPDTRRALQAAGRDNVDECLAIVLGTADMAAERCQRRVRRIGGQLAIDKVGSTKQPA